MKKLIAVILITAGTAAVATEPQVTVTAFTQAADRTVTVEYNLVGAPAVVTFAVETNGPAGWSAIDGANLSPVRGDVFRKVTGSSGSFFWTPDHAGLSTAIAAGNARVKLTAWSMGDTPGYLVISLAASAPSAADRIRYYTCADELPGGLLDNTEYRKTRIVMKRVRARGIPWTMGSPATEAGRLAAREATHSVTLTNDYYLGVFPLTSAQMSAIYGAGTTGGYPIERSMRIRDRIYYKLGFHPVMRNTDWPEAPAADSILGKLRAMTAGEIDNFDLPSEAQWEFAARAGQPSGFWGDGTPFALSANNTADAGLPGRYRYNQETQWWSAWTDFRDYAAHQPVGNGCPIAGSYPPNAWGFYDMHGGIWEWCLDWYADDILGLNGAVNAKGAYLADGVTPGAQRCQRGGSYIANANVCRAAYRGSATPTYPGDSAEGGARVCCQAGLR